MFRAFLRLGLTSFGGPVAHIGYFRADIVERRAWIDDRDFAGLFALCQALPGPASSQLGFAIGLRLAGWRGAAAAWVGFTLPSVLLMLLLAHGAGLAWSLGGLAHGLKLVAAVIVAHALIGMARSFAAGPARAALALAALMLVLLLGSAGQLVALALAALFGALALRDSHMATAGMAPPPLTRAAGVGCLALFVVLLVAPLLLAAAGSRDAALFAAFFRAGALVFGGGHVVLPMLETAIVDPGWITRDDFIAGYSAAQALPGPLFSVAAYFGALIDRSGGGVAGAAIALAGLFSPGLLLLAAALPWWHRLAEHARTGGILAGINAAVVGVLAAAFFDPVLTGAILSPVDALLVVGGLAAMLTGRIGPLTVVAVGVVLGVIRCG